MLRALRQYHIPIRAQAALMGGHWKMMYSTCATKTVDTSKPRKRSSKKLLFAPSASKFGYVEECGLRIRITDNASFSDTMGIDEATEPLPPSATDLYLDEFGPGQILTFHPKEHPEMNDDVRSFLAKLSIVAMNNARFNDDPREETHIDNMVIKLLEAVKHDDGRDLLMSSNSLSFSIGDKYISAKADREVRRETDILWVTKANEHLGGGKYKLGDIQLAACMIAAHQENAIPEERVYPDRMMGIKIRGDMFHFYAMKMTESYLLDLTRSAPGEDVEVFKYPGYHGLCITVPEERRQILSHLWSMRCYATKLY